MSQQIKRWGTILGLTIFLGCFVGCSVGGPQNGTQGGSQSGNGPTKNGSGPPSIKADSRSLPKLADRVQTLEKYVTFRRQYRKLEFDLFYQNNSGGFVPGPSEWDIRLIAEVAVPDLAQWHPAQVSPKTQAPPQWVGEIAGSIPKSGITEWYMQSGVEIGIDAKAGIVAYRNVKL